MLDVNLAILHGHIEASILQNIVNPLMLLLYELRIVFGEGFASPMNLCSVDIYRCVDNSRRHVALSTSL